MIAVILTLFVALNALDGWLTYRAIQLRVGSEANPIPRWLMGRFGVLPTIIGLKAFALVSAVVTLQIPYGDVALSVLNVGLGYVVGRTHQIVRRAKT